MSTSTDKRAYESEWLKLGEAVHSTVRPAQDPLSIGQAERRSFGNTAARVVTGRVVDAVAYTQCYRVFFELGIPPMPCVLASQSSFTFGARSVNTIALGTQVWVILHPQLSWGVIFATEPGWNTDPTLALSDYVHQSSRCGLRVDSAHSSVLALTKGGNVIDWSHGRPFDSVIAGEGGWITETGLRIMLDSGMAQLGTGEMCGVFAHYYDDLLRIAGYNYQHATSSREVDDLNDQGESHVYDGSTPYPWEQSGALKPGVNPYRVLTAQQSQIDEPYYAGIEPLNDDQMAFHRVLRLGGYLGQGGRRMVLVPPDGDTYRYSGNTAPSALFEEFTSLTGRHVVRSAKGIFLIKQPAIPGPKRVKRCEDAGGDTEQNYKFAGAMGSGPAHAVSGQVTPSSALPHLQQAASLLDTVSYVCNWEGVHPLYYHQKDWFLPEEDNTAAGQNQAPLNFAALANQTYLPLPPSVEIMVDHRYNKVPFYLNSSIFGMLDDGGFVLSDGYGVEIRSAGGHLFLSAPRDIWLKSGMNTNVWAGFDAIVKAKNAVDVSATNKAVHIKADTDIQVVAGNNGKTGAVLIESKAPGAVGYVGKTGDDVVAGGIQFKAAHADLLAWTRNVYLRTGGGDVDAGDIFLDANKGQKAITTNSSQFVRYLGTSASDYFGSPAITSANVFTAASAVMGSGLSLGNTLLVAKNGATISGNVQIDRGHVFSQLADSYQNKVPAISGNVLNGVEATLNSSTDSEAAAVTAGTKGMNAFTNQWYKPNTAGNDAVIQAAGFSFRDAPAYRTTDLVLFEDRWQQMARLTNLRTPAQWKENAVVSGSTRTYPHPGKARWVDAQAYLTQDLTLYDAAKGASKPRSTFVYSLPTTAVPEAKMLDNNYPVII